MFQFLLAMFILYKVKKIYKAYKKQKSREATFKKWPIWLSIDGKRVNVNPYHQ
jgi:hypothetical protein